MDVSAAPGAARPDGAAPAAAKTWIPFEQFWKGRRVHLKRGRLYSYRYRRDARRYNKKLRDAKPAIGRTRELRFVAAYARRLALLAVERRGRIKHGELVAAAVRAAWDAGYIHQPARHGRRLMNLPRIQQAVNDAFDKAQFTIEDAALELAGIAKNVKTDVNARIRAIELRFKLTTGLAVTPVVAKLQHQHQFGDGMFDPEQMHTALPVDPVALEGDVNADHARTPARNQEAPSGRAVGKKQQRKSRREDVA